VQATARANPDPSSFDFADYLEAKIALDERSLNAAVRRACIARLGERQPVLRWLDTGTGTGAMVRRLVRDGLPASLSITALDSDARLLDLASAKLTAQLEQDGYVTRVHGATITADRAADRITVELPCSNVFDFAPRDHERFDFITAHALMDVIPLQRALSRFRGWLAPGGLLYATLTYDGDTALLPRYRDADFESMLLARYDASMEERRVQGEATGGARAGRRLHAALSQTGFDVIAYGSADWNATPLEGRYRDRDADVLCALLAFIRGEGERDPAIDPARLARWYAERRAAIDNSELGIIVHQLDVLAVARSGFTPFT
jgi:SAM-dependent methyltransferase